MPDETSSWWDMETIREKLNIFDDVDLDAFCVDYFSEVRDKFGEGMRKDVKINLLLDHCRKTSERQQTLLEKLSKKFPDDPQIRVWLDIARRVISPLPSPPPLPPEIPLHLPGKTYQNFVGRSDELGKLMSVLRNPQSKPIVAVIGMGGIGKTALAREAVDACEREKLFEYIIWVSTQVERFVGEGPVKTGVSDYNFDQLLNDIAYQCRREDIIKMPPDQKKAMLRYLLAQKHVLIVMDNLETIPEHEKFVDNIFQILGCSRLLITSKWDVGHDQVYTISLGKYPEKEGIIFLREEGKARNIEVVEQARDESLVKIYRVTGGSPLAMKLVVGQLSRQSLETVLKDLKEPGPDGPTYEFYRFIFKYSWDMLDLNAKKLLVSMAVFSPGIGGKEKMVKEVSRLEEQPFRSALNQLVILSFVDPSGNLEHRRYAIHQLTQYFVLSDIVKKWG